MYVDSDDDDMHNEKRQMTQKIYSLSFASLGSFVLLHPPADGTPRDLFVMTNILRLYISRILEA